MSSNRRQFLRITALLVTAAAAASFVVYKIWKQKLAKKGPKKASAEFSVRSEPVSSSEQAELKNASSPGSMRSELSQSNDSSIQPQKNDTKAVSTIDSDNSLLSKSSSKQSQSVFKPSQRYRAKRRRQKRRMAPVHQSSQDSSKTTNSSRSSK